MVSGQGQRDEVTRMLVTAGYHAGPALPVGWERPEPKEVHRPLDGQSIGGEHGQWVLLTGGVSDLSLFLNGSYVTYVVGDVQSSRLVIGQQGGKLIVTGNLCDSVVDAGNALGTRPDTVVTVHGEVVGHSLIRARQLFCGEVDDRARCEGKRQPLPAARHSEVAPRVNPRGMAGRRPPSVLRAQIARLLYPPRRLPPRRGSR